MESAIRALLDAVRTRSLPRTSSFVALLEPITTRRGVVYFLGGDIAIADRKPMTSLSNLIGWYYCIQFIIIFCNPSHLYCTYLIHWQEPG